MAVKRCGARAAMTIQAISIPDIQFTGEVSLEKLRRLNDEFKRVGRVINSIIGELNALIAADNSAVTAHVLATTTGLGDEHTVSGLTAGQVLKAGGATTALFGFLTFQEMYQVDPGSFNSVEHGDVLQYWNGFYSMRPLATSGGAPAEAAYLVSVAHAGLANARVAVGSDTIDFDLSVTGVIEANVIAGSITHTHLDRAYARDFMLMGG